MKGYGEEREREMGMGRIKKFRFLFGHVGRLPVIQALARMNGSASNYIKAKTTELKLTIPYRTERETGLSTGPRFTIRTNNQAPDMLNCIDNNIF
jgi:hypothetical protein